MAAKISWYTKVNGSETYRSSTDIFAGTYSIGKPLNVDIQLWNNRYGETPVDDLKNFKINIRFQGEEDSSLLKYCTCYINSSAVAMAIINNVGVIQIPSAMIISGAPNSGASKGNEENYLAFTLSFLTPLNVELKENDLKTLYLEIAT